MRTILCFGLLLAQTASAGAWSDWSHRYDEDKPINGERDYILRIFDYYSQLRQNFEKEGYSERSRDLLEDYTTALLLPACQSCARLCAHGNDRELLLGYFRLLQFTGNSASEAFSTYLADIFIANPALVEDAYRRLSPDQQRIVYSELAGGFAGNVYGQENTASVVRLKKRLARMRSRTK